MRQESRIVYLVNIHVHVACMMKLYVRHEMKKISFVIPIGLYLEKTSMPLWVIIFFWLCFQLVLHFQPNIHYNIAWMSHLSGFTAGFLLAWFVK